jgi:large subunit ribosomal protein L35
MASRILARASRFAGPSRPLRAFVRAESTVAFEPALPRGQEPAYDAALEYIAADAARVRAKLEKAQAEAGDHPTPEQAERIRTLQVNAEINDPATRRLFASTSGVGSMDRAVMRELAARAWRREGGLDLLMQRLFQLGVVPDMLPDILPIADMTVSAGAGEAVEAGKVLPPSSLKEAPRVHVQLFEHPTTPNAAHPNPEAKYTLLVVDPDSPDHENHTFTQRVHYAKTDISLSVLSGATDLMAAPGNELLAYEAPAPPKGSGKHRYVFLLVKQGDVHHPVTRDNFTLRTYLEEHKLSDKDVVAASLVRSQWSEDEAEYIAEAYQSARGEAVPEYALPPKELKYGYPLNARQQRQETIRQEAIDSIVKEFESLTLGQEQVPQ